MSIPSYLHVIQLYWMLTDILFKLCSLISFTYMYKLVALGITRITFTQSLSLESNLWQLNLKSLILLPALMCRVVRWSGGLTGYCTTDRIDGC